MRSALFPALPGDPKADVFTKNLPNGRKFIIPILTLGTRPSLLAMVSISN